jgi:hypothetical protein
VRTDVGVAEVKALLVGRQAMQGHGAAIADRVMSVVFDRLRRGANAS